MTTEKSHINQELDQLFRKSYGKLVSQLMNRYGVHQLEIIENAVMEAYYRALKSWPFHETPRNPQGWLYRTANNAYIDMMRKSSYKKEVYLEEVFPAQHEITSTDLLEDLKDPELKLLFLICHPELSKEDQLAFMLKTMSGFGDREISRALMTKEATIKKRLLRARKTIREKGIAFEWPDPHEFPERLTMVHTSLYLLFNEGFYSTHPEHWIRKDLCLEAMRLCKYLVDHPMGNFETAALMSLMCYHISRYESRLDEGGHIILLDKQDRSKWDPYFIKLGHHYLEKSAVGTKQKSKYQIEAFISAQHCMSKSIEETDWKMVKFLYNRLYHFNQQNIVLLNLVMVHLHLEDIMEAKKLFESIDPESITLDKTMYYMVGVELFSKLKDQFQIELLLEKAINASPTKKESDFIKSKLETLKKEG